VRRHRFSGVSTNHIDLSQNAHFTFARMPSNAQKAARWCVVVYVFVPLFTLLLDFLVRLAPVRLPSSQGVREQQTLVPDGVEHPKFKPRRSTPACYITCWKEVVPYISTRSA